MFERVRKTFHGYGAATKYRPEWTVGFLAFKAGVNETRGNSITGGGQIYGRPYGAFTPNAQISYTPGQNAAVGGGQLPSLPPEIISLLGGRQGQGS